MNGLSQQQQQQRQRHHDPALYTIPPSPAAVVIAKKFRTKICQNFISTGTCPYLLRCVFAHGKEALRTCAMNLRDNVTSEEAIKAFQRNEIESRQRAGLPALPANMRLPVAPTAATQQGSYATTAPTQPVAPAPATILQQPASQYSGHFQSAGGRGLKICSMQMSGPMEPQMQQYSVVRLDLPPMQQQQVLQFAPHPSMPHQAPGIPMPLPGAGPSPQLYAVPNFDQRPPLNNGIAHQQHPVATAPAPPLRHTSNGNANGNVNVNGPLAANPQAPRMQKNYNGNGMKHQSTAGRNGGGTSGVAPGGGGTTAPAPATSTAGQQQAAATAPTQKSPTNSSSFSPRHGAGPLETAHANEEQSTEVPLPTSPLLTLDIEPLDMPEILGYPLTPQNIAIRHQMRGGSSFESSGSMTQPHSQLAPLPVSEAGGDIPGAGNSETGSELGGGGGLGSSRSSASSAKYRHSPYSWTLVEQHGTA